MIIPDANLLIYAHDSTSHQHASARDWWEGLLSGNEPVGIPLVVVLAFVRLSSHPSLNENPMTVSAARERVESWLRTPVAQLLPGTQRTLETAFDLLEAADRGGNLTTDALIAALSVEHGGIVHSNDHDFERFPGVRWMNPLA